MALKKKLSGRKNCNNWQYATIRQSSWAENGNRGPRIVLTRNIICHAHAKSLLAPERALRISVVTACDNLVLIRIACDGRGEHNLHCCKNSTRRASTPSLGRSISSGSLGAGETASVFGRRNLRVQLCHFHLG